MLWLPSTNMSPLASPILPAAATTDGHGGGRPCGWPTLLCTPALVGGCHHQQDWKKGQVAVAGRLPRSPGQPSPLPVGGLANQELLLASGRAARAHRGPDDDVTEAAPNGGEGEGFPRSDDTYVHPAPQAMMSSCEARPCCVLPRRRPLQALPPNEACPHTTPKLGGGGEPREQGVVWACLLQACMKAG